MNPLLVALDVDTSADALALADRLRGVAGGLKIGSRLFTAEGPGFVRQLTARGDRIFLDLKYHDIPNTVAGAVGAAARLGVWMIDVHASGGADMMRAARRSADESAASAGGTRPLLVGITVLTSLDQQRLAAIGVERALDAQVITLARLAQDHGLDGVVASPQEITGIRRACGSSFLVVTPGIRGRQTTPGSDDQARTLGAGEAIARGADFIVVGRPIIAADDPRRAAEAIAGEIFEGLTLRAQGTGQGPGSGVSGKP